MAEHVIVRQNSNFETEFQAQRPNTSGMDEIHPVERIHELTPYTMLLASLGACTTIVLHTYAQHHDIDLQEAELHLIYKRSFEDDSQNSENIDRYDEEIEQELSLEGDLSEEERQKLSQVAKQCSIHRMMEDGIKIRSRPMTKMEQQSN